MASIGRQINMQIQKTISWEGNDSVTTISIERYLKEMRRYGQEMAKDTKRSRQYLKRIGLRLDENGFVISK